MKLDEYDWRKLPPDLIEWINDCSDVINLSQYQVKKFATPPTSSTAGDTGTHGIAKDGANWYFYAYTGDDGWYKVQLSSI